MHFVKPLIVLAGGFGTRLRLVVSDRPKPLAMAGESEFLSYLMEHWRKQGITDFYFALHYQAEMILSFLSGEKTGLLKGCQVSHSVEFHPLGTGGAIANVVHAHKLSGSFLVANADTWLGRGIAEIEDQPAPCLALVEVADTSRYGSVDVDTEGFVRSFAEKAQSAGAGWINAGLYSLNARHFSGWQGEAFSLERDYFPEQVKKGLLRSVKLKTSFIDIGIPEDYQRFCRWIENNREFEL